MARVYGVRKLVRNTFMQAEAMEMQLKGSIRVSASVTLLSQARVLWKFQLADLITAVRERPHHHNPMLIDELSTTIASYSQHEIKQFNDRRSCTHSSFQTTHLHVYLQNTLTLTNTFLHKRGFTNTAPVQLLPPDPPKVQKVNLTG